MSDELDRRACPYVERDHNGVRPCTLWEFHDGKHLPMGTTTVLSGDVHDGDVLLPIKEGLAVSKDEVLIVTLNGYVHPDELQPIVEHLIRILGPDRFAIIAGMGAQLSKVVYPKPAKTTGERGD